ncbi:hypothetical protein H5410_037142 [Solanum commersonii]|uniref:Uncharacterized protein n=1 Tax=Solanum commersonii TaxID=4109 RepID=A0A9J5YAB8_SOLCO|nr:hypothetical protein H5410_037142 [Solanum commersonii]
MILQSASIPYDNGSRFRTNNHRVTVEPFVLAGQVEQVIYVQDPEDHECELWKPPLFSTITDILKTTLLFAYVICHVSWRKHIGIMSDIYSLLMLILMLIFCLYIELYMFNLLYLDKMVKAFLLSCIIDLFDVVVPTKLDKLA